MNKKGLATPVAFIIFNRPETTRRVFAAIREARPRTLLVVADGPRSHREGEAEPCRQARAVIDSVDWECQVLTDYASENLGCMRRVSSGIDWVFRNVDEAIILEDDCLPHPTFFRFCSELLDRYRHDPRIAQICGVNFQFNRHLPCHSYYFSRYNHIWGWASWRRAWQMNDNEMAAWPGYRSTGQLAGILSGEREAAYWTEVLDRVYAGEIDTWDCRWTFSCWRHNLLSVIPAVNLVSNIGFGPGATHTPTPNRYAAMETGPMVFPLAHPPAVERGAREDDYVGNTMFVKPSVVERIMVRLRGRV